MFLKNYIKMPKRFFFFSLTSFSLSCSAFSLTSKYPQGLNVLIVLQLVQHHAPSLGSDSPICLNSP